MLNTEISRSVRYTDGCIQLEVFMHVDEQSKISRKIQTVYIWAIILVQLFFLASKKKSSMSNFLKICN